MDVFPEFSSTRSYADDEDNFCDRSYAASPDGYTSEGAGTRSLADKRHRSHSDPEHRKRRAIANSNERKRMQSINAGFNSLRNLVCPKSGDKLSKAAILKYTADFIKSLLAEKQQLLADNRYLEELLNGSEVESARRCHSLSSQRSSLPLPGKRRWREAESSSSDEGIGFASNEEVFVTSASSSSISGQSVSELQRQIKELKEKVENEKSLRLVREMDKNRLEKLQHQTPPLSFQETVSSSSSPPCPSRSVSSSNQVPTASASHDLHNHIWRRGLETIVEAIRHVEGDHGIFGSAETSLSQNSIDTVSCSELVCPTSAPNAFESSLILRQLHPICIRELSSSGLSPVTSPTPVYFTPPFHRPSVAVQSS